MTIAALIHPDRPGGGSDRALGVSKVGQQFLGFPLLNVSEEIPE